MQRLLIVSGFSAILFLVGLLAGRAVFAVSDRSEEHGLPMTDHAPLRDQRPDNVAERDVPRVPFMTVSTESTTKDDFEFAFASTMAPDGSGKIGHPESPMPRDLRRQRDALALIHSIFPDADEETAEIWASVYADTDLSEVAFILDQKRQLSGTLVAGSFATFSGDSLLVPPCTETSVDSLTSLAAAMTAVKRNLQGAWSIGFRRTVVLPEIIPQRESMPNELRQEMRTTMYRCFDPGRTVSSPSATHVALPASDGSLMFRLAGNGLTRRGDFQLLPSRQIGLITQVETHTVADSPTIPEAATGVHITCSGEIHYINGSGESITAGRVGVGRVIDLTRMTTNDGVIFMLDSVETELTVRPVETELMTNRLEISNVDCSEETRLLEHLVLLSQ